MPISVSVRTYTGETLATCIHPALDSPCRRAAALALPMLGYVDPYDDTWFNKSQMRLVIPELEALIGSTPASEAEAASDVLTMAELLERKPHRYLVFVGD